MMPISVMPAESGHRCDFETVSALPFVVDLEGYLPF